MACTEEEFLELLGGEVYVDMEKLADISKYGICESVRAEVWKYLLEVAKPDKCMCVVDCARIVNNSDFFVVLSNRLRVTNL